jgi:hydrogenase maturation protease
LKSASNCRPETHALLEEVPDSCTDMSFAGKTIIICVGNEYLGDDGIGIRVANELKGRLLGDNVLVDTFQAPDLSLLCNYSGASKIILVDALKSGAPPGAVSRFAIVPNKGPIGSLQGLHALGLQEIFDVASQTGLLTCPVTIVGVEPKDCTAGEGLSQELAEVVPDVLTEVMNELEQAPRPP